MGRTPEAKGITCGEKICVPFGATTRGGGPPVRSVAGSTPAPSHHDHEEPRPNKSFRSHLDRCYEKSDHNRYEEFVEGDSEGFSFT